MPDIASLEQDPAYDVTWPWSSGEPLAPGLTCVFRVRNEARNLPWVLPPIFSAVQHVLLVDNGSDDGTADVARRVAAECGAADRLTVLDYPHQVSRAGGEHLATPATSVHSLTHFYNWCFSHVRTTYSMKWDGDMVLTPEGAGILRDLSWQLESTRAIVAMPRHPLTVVDESTGWLDLSLRFLEPWVYPMGPDFTFVKAFDWELREFPAGVERIVLQQGLCVEVKWLDADEYAHWRTRRRRLHQHPPLPQAPRVRGGRGDPPRRPRGARRPGQGDRTARRPRHRPRQPRLAVAPAPTPRAALAARLPQAPRPEGALTAVTHPLDDLRLPGPTLVLVDDSDSLALDALQGIEDVPGINPQVVTLSGLTGPLKGWGSVLVVAADRVAAATDGQRRAPPRAVQGRRVLAHRRTHPVGGRAAPGVAAAGPPRRPRGRRPRRADRAPLRLRCAGPAGRDGDGAPGRRPRRHHPRRARRVLRRSSRRARPRRPQRDPARHHRSRRRRA